ncbi:hypothetical protein [Alteromonas oceanisediminis]|uniref:hypothetical protein n=1 Tax=Alteromonas oceanisediminis TaxID=2836180 RepID=UPI001BD97968|nr:hypothetical protein [Alteromonas oceanisediminis]MBT0587746.1 hypothetical protein [Alteromonas oceanisediminis]
MWTKKSLFFSCGLSLIASTGVAFAQDETLKLVTTEWETFTSDGSHSARLNEFVAEALGRAGYHANITIERPAFAGSGLNTGKYDGQIDFIDLDKTHPNFVYSSVYFPIHLHIIGKQASVESVRSFAQIRDSRVAVENRYAATPPLRLIKDVKWSRNPTTFESIANIAGNRSDYLLSDSLMLVEFNRLLKDRGEQPLHRSINPMFTTGLQLSLNRSITNATSIISAFNQTAAEMLVDGSINTLFGIQWIAADVDNNGTSDWITSSNTFHSIALIDNYPESIGENVYRWDSSALDSTSTILIDGNTFNSWGAARQHLLNNVDESLQSRRSSFLDKDAYKRILDRW